MVVDVAIDYAKKTAFTIGAGKTTFLRMPLGQKARILARAFGRRILPQDRAVDEGAPS